MPDPLLDHLRRDTGASQQGHLVSTLQALLEQSLIALSETSDGRKQAQELQDFEIRVNENANLVSGAFRTGAHDDLVVELGLSCLDDPQTRKVGFPPACSGVAA